MRPVTSTAHPRGLPSSQPTLTYYILPCVLAHWLSTGGAASVFLRCASLPCALPSLQLCPLPRDPRGSHSPPSDFYSNSTFFEAFANCPSVSHCNRGAGNLPTHDSKIQAKGTAIIPGGACSQATWQRERLNSSRFSRWQWNPCL